MKFRVIILTSVVLIHTLANFLSIRGGIVPQAKKIGGEYLELFDIDYGSEDNHRNAGFLQGFIPAKKLSELPEKDQFLKWWNKYLEDGPKESSERIKPFYAVDFGTKKDLKYGERPKIIIVNRKLHSNAAGEPDVLTEDLEVREVWQPWLRRRCDFVLRYIVPNRINIIKILEMKGQFKADISVKKPPDNSKAAATVTSNLTFKPSLIERLFGKRDVVISRSFDPNVLVPRVMPKPVTSSPKRVINKELDMIEEKANRRRRR